MLVKRTHLTKMSAKETVEQQMRELVNDAVDLVTEYGDDCGDKVTMMHSARTEDWEGEMNVTSRTSQLPLVDLETDPRMCALLDEGCNAPVHTAAWAKTADQALSHESRMLGP